ncbi:MAG: hypothetical protein ACRD68_10785 [Pyrinomonadaceae bacterium]
MVTFLLASLLLLAAVSYLIYWWQRPPSAKGAGYELPPPQYAGLFGEAAAVEASPRLIGDSSPVETAAERRAALLERAAQGDREVLTEAQRDGDAALYDEVLNALVERADSDKKLLSLVSHVARGERLRANRRLAEAFIDSCLRAAPDRHSAAQMLHVAALSGDAAVYQQAVEAALGLWRAGKLPHLPAEELRSLVESEYWLLPSGARGSGAGFALKRKLSGLRRELAKAARQQ